MIRPIAILAVDGRPERDFQLAGAPSTNSSKVFISSFTWR